MSLHQFSGLVTGVEPVELAQQRPPVGWMNHSRHSSLTSIVPVAAMRIANPRGAHYDAIVAATGTRCVDLEGGAYE